MNLVPSNARLVLCRLGWLFAAGDERDAEILALRHQVLVLQRQVARPVFTEADCTILAVLSTAIDRARLRDVLLIVQPATVIGWHRRLVARRWTQPAAPRRGRPPVHAEIRRLALRMAGENPTWGYRRIHGELTRLGHKIAPSSVWKVLRDAGIDPTPNRTGPTWAAFIRAQARGVIATDFCCVDTATTSNRHRLNRGGDRAANCALYRIVMCRLRWDPRTRAYMNRRTAQGHSKPEIIRCLKRYVARDVFAAIQADLNP